MDIQAIPKRTLRYWVTLNAPLLNQSQYHAILSIFKEDYKLCVLLIQTKECNRDFYIIINN